MTCFDQTESGSIMLACRPSFISTLRSYLLLLILFVSSTYAVEIDVTAYESALVPSGHGLVVPTSISRSRYYPSRLQSMQFMLFFNSNSNKALYVQSEDADASVARWEIVQKGRSKFLRIVFFRSPDPRVITEELVIDPARPYLAAAERYKSWSFGQFWAKRKISKFDGVGIVALGGSPYFTALRSKYLAPFLRHFESNGQNMTSPATATWLTLWRSDNFDTAYPRYKPATLPGQESFSSLLTWLQNRGSIPMPYINANVWHDTLQMPDGLPEHKYSERNMMVNRDGSVKRHSGDLSHLQYVDPGSPVWKEILIRARNSLLDSKGQPSMGVYYDVLASAEPALCYNDTHQSEQHFGSFAHPQGSPPRWSDAFRSILKDTTGTIMVEGFAENYIDLVDVFLMHDDELVGTKVPLWNAVYGTISRSAGWYVGAANQTSASTSRELKQARAFGSRTWGSPWLAKTGNALDYQANLATNFNYKPQIDMISAAPIILEDGTRGVSRWSDEKHITNHWDDTYGDNVLIKSDPVTTVHTTPEWAYSGFTNARWSIKRNNHNGLISGFKVTTSSGKKIHLYYTPSPATSSVSTSGAGSLEIYHGIGIAPFCESCDGWQIIDRDLEADLRDAFPAESIAEVNQFILQKNAGSVAKIVLFPRIPY